MADLKALALRRNMERAEAAGDKDRVKKLRSNLTAHEGRSKPKKVATAKKKAVIPSEVPDLRDEPNVFHRVKGESNGD